MADLKFQLDMDRTAVLELKLGTYIRGDRGQQGPQGEDGPAGTLTDDDIAFLQAAEDAAAASAAAALTSQGAAAGSASAAATSAGSANSAATQSGASATQSAQSATDAANSANAAASAQSNVAASANAAAASATAAHTSETNAATSASSASASQIAAGNSQTAAKTSETNSAASAAAAASSAASVNIGQVLIQTQGPTNVANVFNNLTGYDTYELVLNGLVPTNNLQDLGLHFSYDNGATWLTTNGYGSVFTYIALGVSGPPAVGGSNAVGNILMWNAMANAATGANCAISGTIRIHQMPIAKTTNVQFDLVGIGSGLVLGRVSGVGYWAGSGVPNAFRIFAGAAGFSAGSLSLYGYKK